MEMALVAVEDGAQVVCELTREEWAYVVGLFDGEGNVSMRVTNRKFCTVQCSICVTNTSKEVIDWLVSRFRGFVSCQVAGWEYPHSRPVYRFIVKKQTDIAAVLRGLLPYLIVKRKEAELALTWADKHIKYRTYYVGTRHRVDGRWEGGQKIDRAWELEVVKEMAMLKQSNKNWRVKARYGGE